MTDPQVPAEPANCCSRKRSVSATQTHPTHTLTRIHVDSQVCRLARYTFVLAFGTQTHTHKHEHKHLHAQTHGHELTKTNASTHTPEKATVNEPHSRPKRWHQSGTLLPFGSRRTPSRICLLEEVLNNSKVRETILCRSAYMAAERAKLVGSFPALPYSCCLPLLWKLWTDLFFMNDFFLSAICKTVVI